MKIIGQINAVEEILGIKLGPISKEEKEHKKLTSEIFEKLESKDPSLTSLIVKAAILLKRRLG